MNRFENWFCGTEFWRRTTRDKVLPWILEGSTLGDHVLELGAGPGAATDELRKRAAHVTSLEFDHKFAAKLGARFVGTNVTVMQGDAASLAFPERMFSSAIAILMLHHLRSPEMQDRAFAEIYRVLRRGGIFLAGEIEDDWLRRFVHIRSTFVPLNPKTAQQRLEAVGFTHATVTFGNGGFRLRAVKPLTN
jgi:ubiquinone/menaquinone biosynthesis C-methylase UbiE